MRTKPNREALALAAGHFNGEGSIGAYGRPGRRQIIMTLSQTGDGETPPWMVVQFMEALGFGNFYIVKRRTLIPNRRREWIWQVGRFEYAQAAIAMLWIWLSPEKKAQAKKALLAFRK